jgi:5'-methylthioadenosine phosphorylase
VTDPIIGVIGGSGLYELDGLEDLSEQRVDTPFGAPSDAYLTGTLEGRRMVFLARHGRGHRHAPHEINYRANLFGMKVLGVTHLISVSAVGSLREQIRPGDMVVVDQFIDRTTDRPSSFFGEGIVAHVQFGKPVCSDVAEAIYGACVRSGVTVHRGGTYVCMNGPQFSTRAESDLHRSWGASVIGMTNMPEAKLAREAEICYATLAMATDYDCWHESEEEVSVDAVLAIVRQNVANARRILRDAALRIEDNPDSPIRNALAGAIMTAPEAIPPERRRALAPLIGRYVGA